MKARIKTMTRNAKRMETLVMAAADFAKDVAEYRNNSHEWDYTWWMYEYLAFQWDEESRKAEEFNNWIDFFDFLENLGLE